MINDYSYMPRDDDQNYLRKSYLLSKCQFGHSK